MAELVEVLHARYGALALFYDGLGGRAIALKWRPAAFLPVPLKPPVAQHRLYVQRTEGPGAAWVLPNVADVLAGMVQAGGGLIKRVSLPRGGNGLRRQLQ